METVLDASTAAPFRGSVARRAGLISWARLRGPSFVPVYPDTYVGASVTITLAVRRAALQAWLGPEAVVGGSLAADAHRVPIVDELVEVHLPRGQRPRRSDVVVHRGLLLPFEAQEVGGVRVTTPERTAFDLARRLDTIDGIAMADVLAERHPVDRHRLLDLARRHPNLRGVERVREVADGMELGVQSIPESRTRTQLLRRGVPRPEVQWRVLKGTPRGSYVVVARPDLSWPEYKVALQYDGPDHLERARRMKDIDQDDTLRALGWVVIRVMSSQLADPDALAERVLRELRARGWRP
ncbi:type IV toxin-antitoxin system AbiEi family antitoxin [Actinomycetospora soli]|uniref:type IV toxin-antitoxin system AbiEi family antitoxin n=1 Tax=Actinomycetospora soli TaxID=2893887 RepID=UPI001E5256B9|nr:type IV toxin-antitoxin system AbiEi family antitoxin [Actinomycetospora soli]MCD2189018.1 DUF559 domain-containing protein [Actinomycetospora soli]